MAEYYKLAPAKAEEIAAQLTPRGSWGKDMLYSRWEIEEALDN